MIVMYIAREKSSADVDIIILLQSLSLRLHYFIGPLCVISCR